MDFRRSNHAGGGSGRRLLRLGPLTVSLTPSALDVVSQDWFPGKFLARPTVLLPLPPPPACLPGSMACSVGAVASI